MRLVSPVYVCHKATPVTPDSRWNWDPSGDTSTMVARFLVHGFNGKINVTLTSNQEVLGCGKERTWVFRFSSMSSIHSEPYECFKCPRDQEQAA